MLHQQSLEAAGLQPRKLVKLPVPESSMEHVRSTLDLFDASFFALVPKNPNLSEPTNSIWFYAHKPNADSIKSILGFPPGFDPHFPWLIPKPRKKESVPF